MRKVRGIIESNLKKFLSLMLVAALVIGTINMNLFNASAEETHSNTVSTSVEGVEIEKKAELVSTNGNTGTVKVDFTVKGANTTITQTTTDKIDIVFVLDMSGSMEDKDNKKKFTNAKNAIKEFITAILTEENKDSVKMGVVGFAGMSGISVSDATKKIDLSNNAAALKNSVDALKISTDTENKTKPGRGTNFQAGLNVARTMLAADKDAAKVIVALTDGAPTYSFLGTGMNKDKTKFNTSVEIGGSKVSEFRLINAFNYSTTKGNGADYTYPDNHKYKLSYTGGSKTIADNGLPTISEAQFAKNAGVKIYTIGYEITTGSNAEAICKNVATSNDLYYAANTNAISTIMKSITHEVNQDVAAAQGARIVDQLPTAYMANAVVKSGDATVTGGTTIDWSLADLGAGVTKILSFNVTVDLRKMAQDYADKFANDAYKTADDVLLAIADGTKIWFDLNDTVTFSYTDKDGVTKTADVFGGKSGNPVPQTLINTYKYKVKFRVDNVEQKSEEIRLAAFEGETVSFNDITLTPAAQYSAGVASSNDVTVTKQEAGNYTFTMPKKEATVYVDYTTNSFEVKFFVRDTTNPEKDGKANYVQTGETQTVKYGKSATDPVSNKSTLTFELGNYKYEFQNWDKTFTSITGNTDVYAQYKSSQIQYLVRFWANAGDEETFDTADSKAPTYKVSNPVSGSHKPAYKGNLAEGVDRKEFDYWATADGTKFDFNTEIKQDLDLYAVYKDVKKTFKVQFHDLTGDGESNVAVNGAVITSFTKTVEYGSNVTEIPNDLTKLYDANKSFKAVGDEVRFFAGWVYADGKAINLTNIKSDVDVYAKYTSADRYYTVLWMNDDSVAETDSTVEYGGSATYDGDTPERDGGAQYTYTFTGWADADKKNSNSGSVSNVTSDLTFYAQYSRATNQYSFYFEYREPEYVSGAAVSYKTVQTDSANYDYGTVMSQYEPDIVEEFTIAGEGTETTYKFTGWQYNGVDSQETKKITSNGHATALYEETTKVLVTFKWVDANGDQSTQVWVEKGGKLTENQIPTNVDTKPADETYTWKFAGWDGDVTDDINVPTVFTAQYDPTFIDYTVYINVFLDGEKSESLSTTDNGHYGVEKTYDYANLTGYANGVLTVDGKQYGFEKYDPEKATFGTQNNVINIYFTENEKFQVTYHVAGISFDAETGIEPQDPVRTVDNAVIGYSDEVYAGGTFTPDETVAAYGEDAAAALGNAKYTFTFAGWVLADGTAFTATTISEDVDVYASFTFTADKTYTVTFYDYTEDYDAETKNYVELTADPYKKLTVPYGTEVTLPAAPVKAATGKYTFDTNFWGFTTDTDAEKAVTKVEVKDDEDLYAIHKPKDNHYTVTFDAMEGRFPEGTEGADADLKVVKIDRLYEAEVGTPVAPSREEDARYTYNFLGWALEGNPDKRPEDFPFNSERYPGDVRFEAVYEAVEKEYKVTFIIEQNTYLDEQVTYVGATEFVVDPSAAEGVYNVGAFYLVASDKNVADAKADTAAATMSTNDLIKQHGFDYWEIETENGRVDASTILTEKITDDITVYAKFKETGNDQYTIYYLNADKTAIFKTERVDAGAIHELLKAPNVPSKSPSADKEYAFSGWIWDPNFDIKTLEPATPEPAKEEVIVVPENTDEKPTQENEEWIVSEPLATVNPEAVRVASNGATSNVAAIAGVKITEIDFADKENAHDFVLYPDYDESTRIFTVKFQDWNGRELKTEQVKYGGAATAPANPTRSGYTEGRITVSFTFTGWDKAFNFITEDIVVTAQYRKTETEKKIELPPYDPGDDDPKEEPPVDEPVDLPEPEVPAGEPEIEVPEPEVPASPEIVVPEPEVPAGEPEIELPEPEVPAGGELPQTGTTPVAVFYGIGAACVVFGGVIFFAARRKKRV